MSSEVLEKLDKLATHLMVVDDSLSDLIQTSQASSMVDEIAELLKSREPAELQPLFAGLSSIYELFLLGNAKSSGADAIRLTNDSINLSKDVLGETSTLEESKDKFVSILEEFNSKFGIETEIPDSISASPAPAEPVGETGSGDDGESADAGLLGVADELATHLMMIDDSLSDLVETSQASTLVDNSADLLKDENQPELNAIFKALSLAYEKVLLGDIPSEQCPDVVRLTNASVDLVKDVIGGTSTIGESQGGLDSISGELKSLFDISVSASTAEPADVAKGETTAVPTAVANVPPPPSSVAEDKTTSLKIMDENDIEIFEGFLDESSDSLSTIEENLIVLEEDAANLDIINSLFRIFHSLKGAAGFLGLTEINYLCHQTENMLDQARKSMLQIDSEIIDILLSSRDQLGIGLASLKEGVDAAKGNLPNYSCDLDQIDINTIVSAIERKLYLAAHADEGADGTPKLGAILVEDNVVSAKVLEEVLQQKQKPIGQTLVDMGAVSKSDVEKAVTKQKTKKKPIESTSVKVDTAKLNILLELVGELVIAQSIISQNENLGEPINERLTKDIIEMSKITDGIQDHIMSLRMVPLKQTFSKMNRLVRDVAKKINKRVHLELFGEDTEIDKTIVDQINDPLVHLLRNSVDHGIDSAEEREAAGKPPEGLVKLGAYQKGGNVIIEVSDDGRGVNYDKLLNKGIEQGYFEKGKTYSKKEIIEMIFMPGLSTHEVATDISGRGVGMDVVRKNIQALGGRVETKSITGKGTTFVVKLPLTMAIVDGMLVSVGGERYIIPTVAINESIRPTLEQMTTVVNEGEMLNIRGELVPLVRLGELFGVSNGNSSDVTEKLVIVVSNENEKRGLLVDDLLGQQQVVIKNLDTRLKGITGFSGSSILGDGLVGLILDIGGIFKLASG